MTGAFEGYLIIGADGKIITAQAENQRDDKQKIFADKIPSAQKDVIVPDQGRTMEDQNGRMELGPSKSAP